MDDRLNLNAKYTIVANVPFLKHGNKSFFMILYVEGAIMCASRSSQMADIFVSGTVRVKLSHAFFPFPLREHNIVVKSS